MRLRIVLWIWRSSCSSGSLNSYNEILDNNQDVNSVISIRFMIHPLSEFIVELAVACDSSREFEKVISLCSTSIPNFSIIRWDYVVIKIHRNFHIFLNYSCILCYSKFSAMGVNLPAHLVIIKNTQQYVNGIYQVRENQYWNKQWSNFKMQGIQ